MAKMDNDKLKQAFFLISILGLGILLSTSLLEYLSGFLGAVTLYVLLRSTHKQLINSRFHVKDWLSALILLLLSAVVLSIPFIFIGGIAYGKSDIIPQDPQEIFSKIDVILQTIENKIGITILSDTALSNIQNTITGSLPGFLGSSFQIVANVLLMYFILFFLLLNGNEMEKTIAKYIPLRDENTLFVARKVRGLILSNTIVIPMLGVIQAFAAMLGYWIFGVDGVIISGLMTGVASIIPIVGTIVIWLPITIYLITLGHTWEGIGLFLYGSIVIVNIDNVARFILQKKIANIHPLVTVFGVILGVKLFGFIGVIFGPTLISLFLLLLEIYREEFLNIPAPDKFHDVYADLSETEIPSE